jgi:hypothetical protein
MKKRTELDPPSVRLSCRLLFCNRNIKVASLPPTLTRVANI